MNEQESYQWKVCVKCYTYNQSIYITDAMNGFTMQQTEFPYVCCIVDDCSTDGEQEVIKKYLQENFDLEDKLVVRNEETEDYVHCFAQHKVNKNCFFAVFYLKYNHYRKKGKIRYISEWFNNAEYIAICEGDDYWTDSTKLQKQAKALDINTDCTVCGAGFEIHDIMLKGSIDKTIQGDGSFIFTLADWGNDWYMKTLTIMYRIGAFKRYIAESSQKKYKNPKDIHVQYHLLKEGNGVYLCENMGVYNRNDGGIWGGLDEREKVLRDYQMYKELYLKNDKEYNAGRQYFKYILRALSTPGTGLSHIHLIKEGLSVDKSLLSIMRLVKHNVLFISRNFVLLFRKD